jgi:phosphomannomutase
MVVFARASFRALRSWATTKCSNRMYDDIARRGSGPVMWRTGHLLIKSALREERATLGGEMSGQMFFADSY